MYVKTTKVRRGNRCYEYVTLVEAVRDGAKVRHEVIARLGEAGALRASGELERIVAALGAHAGVEPAGEVEVAGSLSVGVVAVIDAYWQRLDLAAHFARAGHARSFPVVDAVFAMIANRLAEPTSKRAIPEWANADVAMPHWWTPPAAHHYYRALDVVHDAKDETETHLYSRLCDLTNLDLRLVCYDLTSSYFEGDPRASSVFASKQFGYSRDHRRDRPQVVIGLVMTGDGFPIAHHVFAGNTTDASTLPGVLADVKQRFAIGEVTVVADRGLITADNLAAIATAGFAHILATRLHNNPDTTKALEASRRSDAVWEPAPRSNSAVCDVDIDGKRMIVVTSIARWLRDHRRGAELRARTEQALNDLERRVRAGRLKDPTKIMVRADRILRDSGVGRCYDTEITASGLFLWHYNDPAIAYEDELLAGRFVLTTSHPRSEMTAAEVLAAYRQLLEVESTFRVLKDMIELRPMRHWTETRVRAHIAVCVYAALIEALIETDLRAAAIVDPDIVDQTITARRALRELARVHRVQLDIAGHNIERVTRPNALQQRILTALGATIT